MRQITAFKSVVLLILILPVLARGQATISGIVRNAATGVALAGIDLDVFDSAGAPVTVTGSTTLVDGTFTITLPGPGDFLLRADPPNGSPLCDQYYNDAFLPSQATPIQVPASAPSVTGITFNLKSGYAILGRVTGSGLGAGDIDLDLYAANGEFLSGYPARTAADGTFTIGALPNGSYYLRADPDPALGQYLLLRYYGGSADIAAATAIVINGASITGRNWDLPPGGIISGLIQSATGTPLPDIDLDVYDASDTRLPYTARSLADGSYYMGPMPAGSYKLRADPLPVQGYVRGYYGYGIDQGLAALVDVALNQTTPNIDFTLQAGGTISGMVKGPDGSTPLAGIDLDVFDANGRRVDLTAKTGTDGGYLLGALPPGSYSVRADPLLDSGYAGIYHGGTSAPSSAMLISVTAGLDTGNISMTLPVGGWLAGVIRDAGGNPLAGIDLDAFDASGQRLYPNARSGTDGSYSFGPFPVGGLIVRADPGPTSGHAHQYYPGADDRATAVAVMVPAASGLAGIDFALAPAGWISGTIRDNFGFPLQGIDLDLYDALAGNRVTGGATSASDGSYLIGPLKFGTYHLRADPEPSQPYVRSYYAGAQAISAASPITVNSTTGNSGIDFALEAGRSLSGRLFLPNLQPAQGIDMDVINLATGKRREQTATTDASGHFVIPPVPYGTYVLRADPLDTLPYLDTYYGNVPFASTATPITVESGSAPGQLDITLLPYVVPVISRQPGPGPYLLLKDAGGTLSFSVDAPSGAVAKCQLYKDGALLLDNLTNPFSIDTASLPAGVYTLLPLAVDIYGRATAGEPFLVVNPAAPPLIGQPVYACLPDGSGKTLLVWQSAANTTYRLESAATLQGPWTVVGNYPGTGALLTHLETVPSSGSRYLRILQLN